MEFSMTIGVDLDDLEEIEKNYDKLSEFLVKNFVSFSACLFVLQELKNCVEKAKQSIEESED